MLASGEEGRSRERFPMTIQLAESWRLMKCSPQVFLPPRANPHRLHQPGRDQEFPVQGLMTEAEGSCSCGFN